MAFSITGAKHLSGDDAYRMLAKRRPAWRVAWRHRLRIAAEKQRARTASLNTKPFSSNMPRASQHPALNAGA